MVDQTDCAPLNSLLKKSYFFGLFVVLRRPSCQLQVDMAGKRNHTYHTSTTTSTGSDVEEVILASVILGLLTIGTIFGNGLVCLAFQKIRTLRTVTNYFVVSLSVADLLVGFVSMPLWFTSITFGWPDVSKNYEIYVLWLCLDIASATASIMNLAVISIDRFYAITSPLKYPIYSTKKRACVYIVLVWAYALGVASIRATPFFGKWYSYFVAIASFFIPLPVMVYCYLRIFKVARFHAAKIRKLEKLITHAQKQDERQPLTSITTLQGTTLVPASTGYSKQRFRSEMKAAKTLAIVMGAFILCWTPYIITLLIDVSCDGCIPFTKLKFLARLVKWLHYSNSLLNPIIYAVLNKGFRDGFMKVLCKQSVSGTLPPKNIAFTRQMNGGNHADEEYDFVEKLSVV